MATGTANENLTELLRDWRHGDRAALDRLTPIVYEEIRRMAHRYMQRERHGHTLQTTALINEAYIRLLGQQQVDWNSRTHFFAVVAQVMRHVLIDHARSRHYLKRGGEAQHVPLDEALSGLAQLDQRKARVVELRYFGGFSLEETAEVLDVSVMTVRRDWNTAKAWLYRQIAASQSEERNS